LRPDSETVAATAVAAELSIEISAYADFAFDSQRIGAKFLEL